MRVRTPTTLLVVSVVTIVLATAGCGSSSTSSAPPTVPQTTLTAPQATLTDTTGTSSTTLDLAADPNGALTFDKTALEAPAGKIELRMTNASSVDHNIAIEGDGVDARGAIVNGGGISTVTAELSPGTYTFYCSVDGHKDAGMRGTLTVR